MPKHNVETNNFEKEVWTFLNAIRGAVRLDMPIKPVLIATLLYLYAAQDKLPELSYEDVLEGKLGPYEDIPTLTKEYLFKEEWDDCKALRGQFSEDILRHVVLAPITEVTRSHFEETPKSVSVLATKLLEITEKDNVADLCCGTGGFEINYSGPSGIPIDCFDFNTQAVDILKLRSLFLECDPRVVQTNVFSLANINRPYDKVFSNYPFVVNLKNDPFVASFLNSIPNHPAVKAKSSDWVFNSLIMNMLSSSGKAVVVMAGGSLFNTPDGDWRKWFVENGWIEAIISLPANMFSSFSIPTFLVVLSHDNKEIRMIDATQKAEKGRRQSFFTDEAIEEIVSSAKGKNILGKTIDSETIRENDYYLFPTRYLSEQVSFKNEAKFGEVINKTSRGAMISAKELDDMVTDKDTGITYLQLKNIQNGIIEEPLENISELTPDMKKHCAQTGNVIIPKIYSDGKIAVIDLPKGKTMVVSGNMFILELDESKVYPYYVKAFLESEWGKSLLKGASSGTTIPTINLSALKSMPFPLPSKKEQLDIVNKYLAAQDEIRILQAKLQAAEERLAASIGDGGDWLA